MEEKNKENKEESIKMEVPQLDFEDEKNWPQIKDFIKKLKEEKEERVDRKQNYLKEKELIISRLMKKSNELFINKMEVMKLKENLIQQNAQNKSMNDEDKFKRSKFAERLIIQPNVNFSNVDIKYGIQDSIKIHYKNGFTSTLQQDAKKDFNVVKFLPEDNPKLYRKLNETNKALPEEMLYYMASNV